MQFFPIKLCIAIALLYASLIILVNFAEYKRSIKVDRRKESLGKDKYILVWNQFFGDPYYGFGGGRSGFVDNKCEYANCYLTDDKLLRPQHEFDAILFHGYEFYELLSGKPKHRSERQLYVFASLESALNTDIPQRYDYFYNVTLTYRLDSDVPWTYFRVKDVKGEIIAPALDPKWIARNATHKTRKELRLLTKNKRKMAAWLVSDCRSRNNREGYVRELRKYVSVDVYGKCGDLICPLSESDRCNKMIRDDYYFYLAFENSNCEDYITEKVLTGLNFDAIPIIYSGANLTRFLPPHSYVDAAYRSPKRLASEMKRIVNSEYEYLSFFWWKDLYTIEQQMPYRAYADGTHPFCRLCEILNSNFKRTVDVTKWWSKGRNNLEGNAKNRTNFC